MKKNFICLMGLAAMSMAMPTPMQAALTEVAVSAPQDGKQVKGRVVDAAGEPIIGARIQVVETNTLGVSDQNGNFTISASQGQTLRVSCIGFTTREVRIGRGNVTVKLSEDTKMMEDLVVVGYGSMQRKDVTSSITTVKAEELNKGVFTDPAQMLQGKVPGLVVTSTGDPNGSPSITLRGASSLRSGEAMSPYYVIDGIPGVDISMVSPDDIETIDILRDATATAIYGSKAANGVIIITTKKGRNDRVSVSYSGYAAFDKILNTYDMATASDLRDYAAANGVTLKDGGADTNWQDEVVRTGVSHNHNVSINGGNKKTSYMASANVMKRQGVIKETGNDRFNLRSLVSTKILKDHLDIALGANMMYGKHFGVPMGNEGASVLDAMNYFSPTNDLKNPDGSWTIGSGSKNYNPLALMYEDTSNTIWKRNQFTGKASLHIIDGLTWNANYSWSNFQSTYSGYDSHFSQLEGISNKNGQASRNSYFGKEQTFETYGNYDKTFSQVHKLSLMAGYSWEERERGDGFGLTVHDFYNDDLKWNNLSYASTIDGIPAISSGVKQNVRNISFYGRVGYSYDSRYILQATVRRDGSSVFGKDNRWGTFPSVSAAWNITEEDFLKDQDVVNTLKLRLGYGVSGNAMGFDAYTAVATYGATGFFDFDGKPWRTLGATKNPNPDLKWESTGMFNIGLDYAFLGGRLSGSIEFYNKKTNDLIWSYPVPTDQNIYGWIDANVGEITNRGVELSISAIPVKTRNFSWNTSLNLSHNMNRVDRLSSDKFEVGTFSQGDPMVSGVSANGWTQRIIEGQPLGTFYTYQWAGFENGSSVYYERDEDGNLTGNTTNDPQYKDRTITGCAQPKLNLGWNNTLNYKNWSLNAFFTGVFGNDVYNSPRAHYTSAQMFSDGKNVMKEFLQNPAGDASGSLPSDRYIENGSYLRLQTLTLGYTFENCFNDWMKSLQLYATCNNVFTITGYDGLDAEVNLGGIDPGIDYRWSRYPHTRSFIVGAKINF